MVTQFNSNLFFFLFVWLLVVRLLFVCYKQFCDLQSQSFKLLMFSSMSVTVLRRCIDAIAFQKTTPIPQDHSQATYFGGRQAKDGEIDWHNPARDIHNLVRALLPIPQYPGAFGKINGHIIRVVASRLIEPHHALEKFSLDNSTSIPGTVVQELSQSEFIVTCGDQGQQRLWIQGEHYR